MVRNNRLGRATIFLIEELRLRGTRDGRLGEGGGEYKRWLKLNREEVEETPLARSWWL